MKYYKFIVKGNDKTGGVLYAPSTWPYPIARDAEEVKDWQSLVVELKYGRYMPFHACTGGANLVSLELKQLLESFLTDKYLEFLPIKAISNEYGDRVYFIMHFTKICDVVNWEKTIYDKETNVVLKIRLDSNKVKGLKVFNSRPAINDVLVSEDVVKAIKREKLDSGLEFMRVYCDVEV